VHLREVSSNETNLILYFLSGERNYEYVNSAFVCCLFENTPQIIEVAQPSCPCLLALSQGRGKLTDLLRLFVHLHVTCGIITAHNLLPVIFGNYYHAPAPSLTLTPTPTLNLILILIHLPGAREAHGHVRAAGHPTAGGRGDDPQ